MAQEETTQYSVVMIRGGALGDHVLTLPAVRILRQQFPNASLGWIGHPARGLLARPQHLLDADGPIGASLYSDNSTDLPDWVLRAQKIIVYSSEATALVARLQACCDSDVSGWDPRPPAGAGRHQTEHLASAIASDPDHAVLVPEFAPTAAELARAGHCWSDLGLITRRVVLLHAGSGGRAKCWQAEGFLTVGERLEQQGWSIAVLGGPAEDEHAPTYAQLTQRWPVVRADDPVQLAALLVGIGCLIGNDSGPGHLAAAVGSATLTLFGPTDPALWRPLGPRSLVLQAPSGKLQALEADSVLEAAGRLLDE